MTEPDPEQAEKAIEEIRKIYGEEWELLEEE